MIINFDEIEEKDFSILPEGDYRVRIEEVSAKTFKSGNDGFEITLGVSGKKSKLWFYLVLDASDVAKTNQRVGSFMKSFGITDGDTDHYTAWCGKIGGVKVKHEEYNGKTSAKVHYVLSKKQQESLPAWSEPDGNTSKPTASVNVVADDDLPFGW